MTDFPKTPLTLELLEDALPTRRAWAQLVYDRMGDDTLLREVEELERQVAERREQGHD